MADESPETPPGSQGCPPDAMALPIPETAGFLTAEHLRRDQAWEDSKAKSFEDRAGRVLAASLTALGLLAAVAKIDQDFDIRDSDSVLTLGAAAVLSLSAAAVTSVGVIVPMKLYKRGSDESLGLYLQPEHAYRPASWAARNLWVTEHQSLVGTRNANRKKAQRLLVSMYLLIIGTVSGVAALVTAAWQAI